MADLPSRARRRTDLLATRLLDIVGATVVLALLSPLLVAIGVLIRVTSKGPALFRHSRVGLDGRPFTMYKFRTMRADAPPDLARDMIERELRGEDTSVDGSYKPADNSHVTRIGSWLRRTSLDEIPQLMNVLVGDMALVGPRPCLPWEADMFPPSARARFTVKPGLTGLWQVSGRSRLGTLDMLRLDVDYASTRSLGRDLSILARTVPALLRGDGAR